MRELTRSLGRFSWAMSLFGFKQLANMMSPPDCSMESPSSQRAPDAFDAMSRTVEGQLGDTFHQAFTTGDRLLSTVVDAMFGLGNSANPWMGPRTASHSDPLGDWGPFGESHIDGDWGTAPGAGAHGSSPFEAQAPFEDRHAGGWPGHPSSETPPPSYGMSASPWDPPGPSASTPTLDDIGGWGPMPAPAPAQGPDGPPHGSFAADPSTPFEAATHPDSVGGWGPMPPTPSTHT